MKGIKIQGKMIDVYRMLRDIAWMYPGLTLNQYLSIKPLAGKVWEQLAEIAREVEKRKGE